VESRAFVQQWGVEQIHAARKTGWPDCVNCCFAAFDISLQPITEKGPLSPDRLFRRRVR